MTWFNHDFMYGIAMACIHSLWQGMLILGIVSLIKSQLSNKKTRQIYWIYFSGLSVMLFLWVFTLLYYLNPAVQPLNLNLTNTLVGIKTSSIADSVSERFFYYSVSFAWLMGAILFMIKALLNSIKINRIKRSGTTTSPEWQLKIQDLCTQLNYRGRVFLKHTSDITIPFVVGLIKPVIMIPSIYLTQLTPIQLEAILVHELSHIKHQDFLFNSIQVIIESILFYHPATWLMGKKIRQYREYICDEQVQSKVDTLPYLEALYRIAIFSKQDIQPTVALYNQKNELIMRVKRMLNEPFADFQLKPLVYVFVILIIPFSQFAFSKAALDNKDQVILENLDLPKIELAENVTQPIMNIDPLAPSIEILQKIDKIKVRPNRLQQLDTVPPPEKIETLQKKIQEKSLELEKLSEQFSTEMKSIMEPRIKELEFKSQLLEKELAPKMKEMEKVFESQEFAEIEKRQAVLELRLHESMAKLEERMNSNEMMQLEKQMELKSEQLEKMEHDFPNEEQRAKMQKLQKEMQIMQGKMQFQMQDVQKEHQRIMNDPAMKKMQEEMKMQHKKMEEIHQKHQTIWNEETKVLQKEIHKLQQQIEIDMQSINQDLHQKMELKNNELKQLHQELEKAMHEKQ